MKAATTYAQAGEHWVARDVLLDARGLKDARATKTGPMTEQALQLFRRLGMQPLRPEGGEPEITIVLNETGARQLEKLTEANVGKRLALVLDGALLVVPLIREAISSGEATIAGSAYTEEEANRIVSRIKALTRCER